MQPCALPLADLTIHLPAIFPLMLDIAHSLPGPSIGQPHRPTTARHVLSSMFWGLCAISVRRLNISHVHAHFAFAPARLAARIAEKHGVPFSVSVHASDIHIQSAGELCAALEGAAFVRACTRHGMDTLNTKTRDVLAGRIHLTRHGVEITSCPTPSEQACPLVLAAGRLVEKKGFSHLVRACRRLAETGIEFRCVIVGDGPLRRTLAAEISGNGLESRIMLAGPRSRDRIAMLLAGAAALAAPSVSASNGDVDGIPNIVLEAMAAGVPVVACASGGIPEAVTHGADGFLAPPGNDEALASHLALLLTNEPMRRAMGAAARRKAQQDFDIERNIRKLVGLFEAKVEHGDSETGGLEGEKR